MVRMSVAAVLLLVGCGGPSDEGVWTDSSGERVSESIVTSYQGEKHCDWQDVTFMEHGDDQYVRDVRGQLTRSLRTTYDGAAELPEGATDTGLRHHGRELWVVPAKDAAYLVSADDVERWPASKQPIGCD